MKGDGLTMPFLFAVGAFFRQHLFFSRSRPLARLPVEFLYSLDLLLEKILIPFLNGFQKEIPRPQTVHALGSKSLAFDVDSGRPMPSADTTGDFIDILSPGPGGTDKMFLKVLLLNAESTHLVLQLAFFVNGDPQTHRYSSRKGLSFKFSLYSTQKNLSSRQVFLPIKISQQSSVENAPLGSRASHKSYFLTTLVACSPLSPLTMSNSTS